MLRYLLYLIAKFLMVSLPRPVKYWIALRISDLYFIFKKKKRKAVFHNLRNIAPDRDIYNLGLMVFRNFGKYLADFLFISRLTKYNWRKWVRIVNFEYLDEVYKKNKGIVMVTCHLGSSEVGGIVVALMGYSISAIILPQRNKFVNRMFLAQRMSKGLQSIIIGPQMKECFRKLKNGEIVVILGDRNLTDSKGVEVDFFGKKTYLLRGPATLAYLTSAPILPAFFVRNKDNTYTLYFESLIEVERKRDKDEFIQLTTQKIANTLEKYISLYPEQWYIFEELWQKE